MAKNADELFDFVDLCRCEGGDGGIIHHLHFCSVFRGSPWMGGMLRARRGTMIKSTATLSNVVLHAKVHCLFVVVPIEVDT